MVARRIEEILSDSNPLVAEYVAEVSSSRGKMIRPQLLLAFAELFGSANHDTAVNCAACCELLHTASLIHDDVIDEADLRRGQPTLNSSYGNQVAVIVGDYILTLIMKAINSEKDFHLTGMLLDTSQELGLGVLAELMNCGNLELTVEKYHEVIYLKTAGLFKLCCAMGAYIGGATPEQVARTGEYGKLLGMAFQIVDDLLDITVEEGKSGKPSFNDLREGRITLPVIHAITEQPTETRQLIAQFEENDTRMLRETVKSHLAHTGSLGYAYDAARDYLFQANKLVNGLLNDAGNGHASEQILVIERRIIAAIPALVRPAAG
jgi:octaprenyl-diphosphate synthase